MSHKTVIYLIIGVLAIGLLFSKYNGYKEKNLDDLFNNIKSIAFEIHGDNRWTTDKKEAIDELTTFLSQYRVKKMKEDKDVVLSEGGFWLHIQTQNKYMMVEFNEELVFIPADGRYKVIFEPIDIEWLESFKEKYRQ